MEENTLAYISKLRGRAANFAFQHMNFHLLWFSFIMQKKSQF